MCVQIRSITALDYLHTCDSINYSIFGVNRAWSLTPSVILRVSVVEVKHVILRHLSCFHPQINRAVIVMCLHAAEHIASPAESSFHPENELRIIPAALGCFRCRAALLRSFQR